MIAPPLSIFLREIMKLTSELFKQIGQTEVFIRTSYQQFSCPRENDFLNNYNKGIIYAYAGVVIAVTIKLGHNIYRNNKLARQKVSQMHFYQGKAKIIFQSLKEQEISTSLRRAEEIQKTYSARLGV